MNVFSNEFSAPNQSRHDDAKHSALISTAVRESAIGGNG